jgi:hypothetical protein
VPTCGPWSSVGSAAELPASEPVALVSGQGSPTAIAFEPRDGQGGLLYWTSIETGVDVAQGTIKAVLDTGGRVTSIAEEPGLSPRQVLLSDGNPYWLFQDPEGPNDFIRWIDRNDNDTTHTMELPDGRAEGLAVAGGVIFWTDFETGTVTAQHPLGLPTGLQPADMQSMDPTHPLRIVADDTMVCWANEGTYSQSDGRVQCRTWSWDAMAMAPVFGMGLALDVPGQAAPRGLALDDGGVYWTNFASGEVRWARRMPDGTFGAAATIATEQGNPNGIAVDAATILWTNWGNGTVMSLAKDALEVSPSLIAHAQDRPGPMVVRPDAVYWLNEGAADQPVGTLVRLAR